MLLEHMALVGLLHVLRQHLEVMWVGACIRQPQGVFLVNLVTTFTDSLPPPFYIFPAASAPVMSSQVAKGLHSERGGTYGCPMLLPPPPQMCLHVGLKGGRSGNPTPGRSYCRVTTLLRINYRRDSVVTL